MIAAVDTNQERSQVAGTAAPTAHHHFLAASALGFEPGFGATGLIGRGRAFGDDAFEVQPACRLQYGIAWFRQMLHELDEPPCSAVTFHKTLQARLAFSQRQAPQILASRIKSIEHEIRQIL